MTQPANQSPLASHQSAPAASLSSGSGGNPFSLTHKQRELLDFIGSYMATEGVGPSYEEMKAGVGLASKSGVHRLMDALEERGFLRRLPYRARAIELFDVPRPQVLAPRNPLARFTDGELRAELERRDALKSQHCPPAAPKAVPLASPI